MQFGGFSITSDLNHIHIKKGITSMTEFSIPKEKIQALSIKKTFFNDG
ncbi:PH domain-containing protein [Lysinibacillus sphaericus]